MEIEKDKKSTTLITYNDCCFRIDDKVSVLFNDKWNNGSKITSIKHSGCNVLYKSGSTEDDVEFSRILHEDDNEFSRLIHECNKNIYFAKDDIEKENNIFSDENLSNKENDLKEDIVMQSTSYSLDAIRSNYDEQSDIEYDENKHIKEKKIKKHSEHNDNDIINDDVLPVLHFDLNEQVSVNYNDRTYNGKIINVNEDDRLYVIKYSDGALESGVYIDRIKKKNYSEQKKQTNKKGNKNVNNNNIQQDVHQIILNKEEIILQSAEKSPPRKKLKTKHKKNFDILDENENELPFGWRRTFSIKDSSKIVYLNTFTKG